MFYRRKREGEGAASTLEPGRSREEASSNPPGDLTIVAPVAATPGTMPDIVPATGFLTGDAREAALNDLADQIRPAAMAYLAGITETPERRAEIDEVILREFARPKVAEYNRDAGAIGEKELEPTTAEIDILNRLRGAGPLQRIMADPKVTDIRVRAGAKVYYERDGVRVTTDLTLTEDDCTYFVQRMLLEQGYGEPLGRNNPEVTIRTPRARITAVHRSIAPRGTIITIRLFPLMPWTGAALVQSGMMPQGAWTILRGFTRAGLNGAIAGETGTGKTTLIQALVGAVDEELQIVTIEDPGELSLARDRFDQLEVRRPDAEGKNEISARRHTRIARRLSPDILIIGEARGAEAWDALSVMQMTPEMSLLSLHAVQLHDVLDRLETMCMENPDVGNMPLRAVRKRIKDTITFIAVVQRLPEVGPDGVRRIRRRLTDLAELQAVSENGYTLETLLTWEDGRLCWTGKDVSSPTAARLARAGVAPFDYTGFPRTRAARQFGPEALSAREA